MSGIDRRSRSRGSAMAVVLIFASTIAAFCVLTLSSSSASYLDMRTRLVATKAFYVAEGGIDYAMSQIQTDTYWPVASETLFPTVNSDGSFGSGWTVFGSREGGDFQLRVTYAKSNSVPSTWTGLGFPSGFEPLTNVVFADRTARPAFDRILLESTGRQGGVQRTVRASVKLEVTAYGAAIVADTVQVAGSSGSGKGFALNDQAVVFDGTGNASSNQYVYGGIRANCGVYLDGSSTPLTDANAATSLGAFTGEVHASLTGTSEEVPDFTNPGSTQQLFDFNRFKAAASLGAGATYTSLQQFAAAMNAANALGKPLEGIQFITVDAAAEGSGPKFTDSSGTLGIPGGINVNGTLAFHFLNAPDHFYKVFIETPLHVNPAPLGSDFDPTKQSTFKSGYPAAISAAKDPKLVNLSSLGFASFGPDDDLPALMFDNGTVDIHQETNICGVVYGPSFIEIENKHQQRMYFNGVLIGGAGIYVQGGNGSGASQTFVFNPTAVDALATFENRGKSPVIAGYVIEH